MENPRNHHIVIRDMEPEDAEEKGRVHFMSWIETYTGHFDDSVMRELTLERSVRTAKLHPENTLVAVVDGVIKGFSCHVKCRDDDLQDAGEVMALYVLQSHQGLGLGKRLMEASMERLHHHDIVVVWVLDSNTKAQGFYRHMGFLPDGKTKTVFGKEALRMVFKRP
jgi:ribosomal protein S18 acetylase RimI-like enzyme